MKQFELVRDEDVTGISGTGKIAEGVVFSDGTAVLRWTTANHSTCLYDSLAALDAIHGHGGKTRVVFSDAPPAFVELPKPHLMVGFEGADAELEAATNNCAVAQPGARYAYDNVRKIRAPRGWHAVACWWQGGEVCLTVRSPARFLRTERCNKYTSDRYEQAEVQFMITCDGIRPIERGQGANVAMVTVDGVNGLAKLGEYTTAHREPGRDAAATGLAAQERPEPGVWVSGMRRTDLEDEPPVG
jgi:hypothetical protein